MPFTADSRRERPRLNQGVLIEASSTANSFTCRDTRSGKNFMLRKIDAQLAQWCDGQHTVEELAQLAQQSGSSLTVDMVADLIRRMTALGILEEAVTAEPDSPVAPVAAPAGAFDDIVDSGDEEPKTVVGFNMDPAQLAALMAPSAPAAPKITPAIKADPPRKNSLPSTPKVDAAAAPVQSPRRTSSLPGMAKVEAALAESAAQPQRRNSLSSMPKVEAAAAEAPAQPQRRNSLAGMPKVEAAPAEAAAPRRNSLAGMPKVEAAPAEAAAPRRNSLAGMPKVEAAPAETAAPEKPKRASSTGAPAVALPPEPVTAPAKRTSQTGAQAIPPAAKKQSQAGLDPLPPAPKKTGATPAPASAAPAMPFDAPNAPASPPPNLADAFGGDKDYDTDMVRLDAAKGASTPADKLEQQLQALSSLSMDSSAAPPAASTNPSASSGGSAKLPWILLALVVLGGGGFFGYTKFVAGPTTTTGPETNPNLPKVRIEVVRPDARKGQTLLAAGYLTAPKIISLGGTEGGRIKKVFVENGAKVKKNQVLIQFDDSAAKAELQLAGAKLGTASGALKRAKQLFNAQAATANDVAAAQGSVAIASAEYNVKKQAVEACKITSSINGTVLDVPVHEGEVIKGDSVGGALVKLADLTEMIAEVDVNEADLPLIRVGQPADVKTDATGDKILAGKVKEISQQADRAKGTVVVKVSLAEVPEMLRPGNSVKVSFREDDGAAKRIILPRSAIVEGKVYVVEGGKAASRAVSYLAAGPSKVEISAGLNEGDRVVVEGGAQLQDGQQVQ